MINNSTLGIYFFARTEKLAKDGKAPVYVRITVDGKRSLVTLKRYIEPDRWDKTAGYAKGFKENAKQLNAYIDIFRNKIYAAHKSLIDNDEIISAAEIKNVLLGRTTRMKTLVQLFEYHNQMMKEKVNIEYAPATLRRFETTLMHIKAFLKINYKKEDILLIALKHQFITDLEHYFRTERGCNHNSTMKYIKNLKKVVNIALNNDWLDKDPFKKFKTRIEPVERDYLTEEELKILKEKEFKIKRLEVTRDVFLFSCYTGLAFADVSKLDEKNIAIGIDGEKWLRIKRSKTNTPCNIPLLPLALEIIEKYKDNPEAQYMNRLLPIKSNQKQNAYLKEIADLCEINKNLTTHLARHTFATTVTLANGVPIESVSSMLGHKSIQTTQIYSKVIEKKVSEDMLALKLRLKEKNKNQQKNTANGK